MARQPRIKVAGHAALYHVVNRVNHKRHKIDNYMKKYFLELLGKLKKLYYVKYAGFTILNNHYHLLLNFLDHEGVDPSDAIRRWNVYHKKTPFTRSGFLKRDRDYVVHELTDISSFMKRFNAHMTQRYNWKNGTVGTLWERRFRSSIIERSVAAVLCGAYIELNAFRASLVAKPEDYEYSSLHQISKGNPDNLVDADLIAEGLFVEKDEDDLCQTYLAYIYKAGTRPHIDEPNGIVITRKMREKLIRHSLEIEEGSLSKRISELIEGKVTGSERLTFFMYDEYINPGLVGQAKDIHRNKWVTSISRRGNLFTLCSGMMRGSP